MPVSMQPEHPNVPPLESTGTCSKPIAKAVCVATQTGRSTGRQDLGGSSNFCLADGLGFLCPPPSQCAQQGQAERRQETHQSQRNLLMLFPFCHMKNKAHFCGSFEGKRGHFRLLLMIATSNKNNFRFGRGVSSALKAGSRLFSPVSFLLQVPI